MQKLKKTILKTTVLVLFSSIMLAGCLKPVREINNKKIYEPNGSLHRVEWEGHIYIQYSAVQRGSICHDPDCPCGKGK